MRFRLTENHIKLLNHMCVYFEDEAYSGAPAVDIKRPYGNRSVAHDIFRIINGKEWGDDKMPVGVREELIDFHRETATALQVVLDTMSFQPGVYEKLPYGIRWRIIKEQSEKQPAAQDAKKCA